MIRGSIPIFWGHERTKINPNPPRIIDLERDPEFKVTEKHFRRLIETYGNEICVLNLVKNNSKSSETILGKIYKRFADGFSNHLKTNIHGPKLRYKWIDFHSIYGQDETKILHEIQDYAKSTIKHVGIFQFSIFDGTISKQNGIFRVNCIDCLDRTNNAMACISSVVVAQSLIKMDIIDNDLIDVENTVVKNELISVLFEIFGVG